MKKNNIISTDLRESAKVFDIKLKMLCTEYGVNSYIFLGKYEHTVHEGKDEAVSIVVGALDEVLHLGMAFDEVLNSALIEMALKDLKKAAGCDECPDRETCRVPKEDRCDA